MNYKAPTRDKFFDSRGNLTKTWLKFFEMLAAEATSTEAIFVSGASGTFTTVDSKTVTVVDGIITEIV